MRHSALGGVVLIAALVHGGAEAASFLDRFVNDFNKALTGQPNTNTNAARQRAPARPAAPAARPQPVLPVGRTLKAANLRAGPGTSHDKVGLVPAGTRLTILFRQGNWYQVRTSLNGIPTNAWIYSKLVAVDKEGEATDSTALQPTPQAQGSGAALAGAKGATVSYAGYSKEFQQVKRMLEQGDLEGVAKYYRQRDADLFNEARSEMDQIQAMGLLRWLERGTLALDQGRISDAVKNFSNAELILDTRQQDSKLKGWFTSVAKFAAETAVGNEELQDYPGEGYERVLMLNYKSIAYLLEGDRRAYNVTRRAIDWQNLEKKAFEEKARKAKEELARKRGEKDKETQRVAGNASDQVEQEYARLEARARSVPSAYVNPFGYYVSGMIQEYESYDDRSLRDNARISYQKALELNPKSKVLQRAVKEMKKGGAPAGTRLVHVVVGDGFVPEKKMLTYWIGAGDQAVPIKLPIYQPVATSVDRIEVQTAGGRRLARLSPVADVEAISLRNQLDMEPFRQLRVMLAVASSVVTKGLLNNLGVVGQALSKKRDEMAAPDMRSWQSLPRTIQAARLRLKKGVREIRLVSYDKRGRRLASKTVKINRNSHDFVYGRSLGRMLYVHAAGRLWVSDD